MRFLLVLAVALVGWLLAKWVVPIESRMVEDYLVGFPNADTAAHRLRPRLLAGMFQIPTLLALVYALGNCFDRYILRQFFAIFTICLAALLMIWILMDLTDNAGDFSSSKDVFGTMIRYYIDSLPAVLMLLMPYSLLLSILYSLGKLSGSREIVAYIQSGRGLVRISLPVILVGLLSSLFCLGLNYHWAPYADGGKQRLLDSIRGEVIVEAKHVVYRNPNDRRLWVIGSFPANYQYGEPLRDIEVTTTDEQHQLVSRLYAEQASWDRSSRVWTFDDARVARFIAGEPPRFIDHSGSIEIRDWPETPWQLIKPGLRPGQLGIPDLNGWLASNKLRPSSADPEPYLTQWHYRWALPFACLVTVMLAVPLAVHFTRRGAGGNVFLAILLSALMLLSSNFALALGESGLMTPAAAAWLPNALFSILALLLFYRRLGGRSIFGIWHKVVSIAR
ncbi:MAG: LptF/LptG family permease [Luteolibacter sp.]